MRGEDVSKRPRYTPSDRVVDVVTLAVFGVLAGFSASRLAWGAWIAALVGALHLLCASDKAFRWPVVLALTGFWAYEALARNHHWPMVGRVFFTIFIVFIALSLLALRPSRAFAPARDKEGRSS